MLCIWVTRLDRPNLWNYTKTTCAKIAVPTNHWVTQINREIQGLQCPASTILQISHCLGRSTVFLCKWIARQWWIIGKVLDKCRRQKQKNQLGLSGNRKIKFHLTGGKSSQPAISPPLPLHSSSVGRCEKGALKWKQKIPATHRTLLPMQHDFHEASGQPALASLLQVSWLLPTEADQRACLPGSRSPCMPTCWCAHTQLLTNVLPRPACSPAPWLGHTCGLPLQNQFHCFSNSKMLSLSSWAGWDGLIRNREPNCCYSSSFKLPNVHCPKCLPSNSGGSPTLGIHIFLLIFQELWIFFFFNFFFFIVIKTKVCVLAHGPSNAIYSCGLFNQSSTSKHKGPMIWGTNVCASTGTNAQLIRAFTSARRVNNLVQGYDV